MSKKQYLVSGIIIEPPTCESLYTGISSSVDLFVIIYVDKIFDCGILDLDWTKVQSLFNNNRK